MATARLALVPPFAFVLAISLCGVCRADSTNDGSLAKAVLSSKPLMDVRFRSEHVDQDGLSENADAVTLRARLGFESGELSHTTLLAEGEFLWPWRSDYNSTTNGHTAFPVVNDPESYELSRLQLANSSIPGTTVTLGRQRVMLDDERFVSRVGWRQNEQTFDALHVVNTSISRLTIDVTYIDQVNRVLGKESALGRYHGDSYLANVGYRTPLGTLTGFGYWLAFDEAPRDSSQTVGVRFSGERALKKVKLAYLASYARQEEYENNPLHYQDDFYVVELTGTLHDVSIGAGLEVLEGDGVKGFTTPLATVHKFCGWADKFTTTPPNGLKRRYVSAGVARKNVMGLDSLGANVVYHDFESARLGIHYGNETDLQVQGKWHHLSGLLKYASYRAQSFATDTAKYWVQVEYAL